MYRHWSDKNFPSVSSVIFLKCEYTCDMIGFRSNFKVEPLLFGCSNKVEKKTSPVVCTIIKKKKRKKAVLLPPFKGILTENRNAHYGQIDTQPFCHHA
ncbi:hypothetical protein ANTPLA_LOCUS8000 [Anthophora plagiata]